jgi:hypothetical protein
VRQQAQGERHEGRGGKKVQVGLRAILKGKVNQRQHAKGGIGVEGVHAVQGAARGALRGGQLAQQHLLHRATQALTQAMHAKDVSSR